MTYATAAQCMEEVKDNPALDSETDVRSDAFDRFLEEADAEINSYIGAKYTLPITDAGDLLLLQKIAIDLVIYRYFKIKDITAMQPLDQTGRPTQKAPVLYAYEAARKTLKDLMSGARVLPGSLTTGQATAGYVTATTGPYDSARW